MSKKGLGTGLSSLLGDVAEGGGEGLTHLPLESLQPGRFQPRQVFDEVALDELADSISNSGLLQPLVVREIAQDRYEIIAGERRWRAAQRARLVEVPVLIREFDDERALELSIVENVQREDLGAVEEARGYQRLIDEFGHTQATVAGLVGKSRPHVANLLRLLSLPSNVLDLVQNGKLSAGHARALIGAENAESLAKEVVAKKLNVRQVEALAKGAPAKSATKEKSADVRLLEEELSQDLGLTVEIAEKAKGGELKIRYTSNEQLDQILRKIRG